MALARDGLGLSRSRGRTGAVLYLLYAIGVRIRLTQIAWDLLNPRGGSKTGSTRTTSTMTSESSAGTLAGTLAQSR